jgi:hypothetical protein
VPSEEYNSNPVSLLFALKNNLLLKIVSSDGVLPAKPGFKSKIIAGPEETETGEEEIEGELLEDTVGLFETEIVGETETLSEIVGVAVTDTVGLLEGEEPIDKDPEGVSDTVGLGELLEDTVGLFETEIVGETETLSEIVGVAVTDTVGVLEGEEPIDKDPEGVSDTVGLGELLDDTVGLFETEIVGETETLSEIVGVAVTDTVGLLEGEEPIDKDPEGVSDTVGLGELLEDTVGLFETEIVGETETLSEIVGVAVTDTVGVLEGEEPIDKDPEGVSDTVGLGELLDDTVGLFETEIVGETETLSEIVGVAVTDTVGLLEGEEPIDKDPEGVSDTVGLGELLVSED